MFNGIAAEHHYFYSPEKTNILEKQFANPKKIYLLNTGLANSVSFQFSENFGRQPENVIFLQQKRNSSAEYF